MNSKTIGEISEAIVIARMLEIGWSVSIPFGDNQRYDLISDDGICLNRIQVKTGRLRDGVIIYALISHTTQGGKSYKGEADFFAIYCPDTKEIYLVPVSTEGTQVGNLRIEDCKNNQLARVNWAKDYIL